MLPIIAAPDVSVDKAPCDRSTREEDGPQLPCLRPGGLGVEVRHGVIVVASNHELLFKN